MTVTYDDSGQPPRAVIDVFKWLCSNLSHTMSTFFLYTNVVYKTLIDCLLNCILTIEQATSVAPKEIKLIVLLEKTLF